jgi:hypothetical protein
MRGERDLLFMMRFLNTSLSGQQSIQSEAKIYLYSTRLHNNTRLQIEVPTPVLGAASLPLFSSTCSEIGSYQRRRNAVALVVTLSPE